MNMCVNEMKRKEKGLNYCEGSRDRTIQDSPYAWFLLPSPTIRVEIRSSESNVLVDGGSGYIVCLPIFL